MSYLAVKARNVNSPNPELMDAQTIPMNTSGALLKAKPFSPTTTKLTAEKATIVSTRILREGWRPEIGKKINFVMEGMELTS